jgi:environmental stress-induced protein Ves
MPWKNGGGSTTELLIEPPGASMEQGFLWRVSMAAVPASGPFSSFPGIDRTLLLVEGAGLELDHGPHGRATLRGPWQPAAFSGDWATHGRLLDGPCRDFNVMSARGRIRHTVAILRPGPAPCLLPEAATVLVFCARGEAALNRPGLRLGAGELLRIDGPGAPGLAVSGDEGETILVAVALHPL